MIKAKNDDPVPLQADDDLDAEIARYESMSDEEIDRELARFGINPQRTILAVQKLVQAKITEWHRLRLVAKK